MRNYFAIGDIHGCYEKLRIMIDKIDIDFNRDTLVCLGDYIDRGPNSFEVVDYLIQLKKKYRNIVLLKGNHEEMLERYLDGSDKLVYLANGGRQTVDSYLRKRTSDDQGLIPPEHIDFFKKLYHFYQTEDYIFVHAGVREKVPIEKQGPEDLLWIRQKFIRSDYDFGKKIIFGHTPLAEPLVQPNKIGVDTGAVYGNKLTCVKLPDVIFYSV